MQEGKHVESKGTDNRKPDSDTWTSHTEPATLIVRILLEKIKAEVAFHRTR